MTILQISLGIQHDIREALATMGDVIYFDWSGHHNNFNQAVRKLTDEHKPDLIWLQIQTPNIIDFPTAQYLASKSFVVNWTGDVRQDIRWYEQIGRVIQLTLFTNMDDVETLRVKGIKADYLQIGFPDKIFKPKGNIKHCPEIIFMANYTQGFPLSNFRKEVVEALRRRYGNRFGVYGNGWGQGSFSVVNQEEEACYYRGCKIAINLSHFDYSRYSSDRIFRLMGAGAFCLSHNYIDIEKDFQVNEHLEAWADISELIMKIDYYLENESERNIIAKAGSKYVHANCKWTNRIKQLKTMIKL